MPGVLGVYTGEDIIAAGLQPIPHDPVPSTKYDMKLTNPEGGEIFIGPHLLLPTDKARHVGEARNRLNQRIIGPLAGIGAGLAKAADRKLNDLRVSGAYHWLSKPAISYTHLTLPSLYAV